MKRIITLLVLLTTGSIHAQYYFSGNLDSTAAGKSVYLSLVEDYRKLTRPYSDQIIHKALVGSGGKFEFRGDNLDKKNRIYRIHLDECSEAVDGAGHFLEGCNQYRSILFLAQNQDTISFPDTLEGEVFCDIQSTNPKSAALLEVDVLKEQMILDFTEIHSGASKELNLKKWFNRLQDYGKTAEEPLTELYIYAFLSDRGSETHEYYLKDLSGSDYYADLSGRLQNIYPRAVFTKNYESEIQADLNFAQREKNTFETLPWILLFVLLISILLNLYFIWKKGVAKPRVQLKQADVNLTQQEQTILHEILEGRSNKEIAAALFISLSTVKSHINSIYKKLKVNSRRDLKSLFKD